MFKGAIHIHSTYSDGEFTLARLRDVYLEAGCSFVCMTDHAEYFDAETLRAYVEACRALSDDRFLFIPGLEFTCDRRMHVLGLGITKLTDATDPREVFRHIERCGGLSVIAHPMDSVFDWIEQFDVLPSGIEAWNTKYDGRYAPRPGTFALLNRLQARKPGLKAFYGMDLHWKNQYRGLFKSLMCTGLNREEILTALGRGDFFATKGDLELPSNGRLPAALLAKFAAQHANSDRFRKLVKHAKRMTRGLVVKVPAPLKSQLRRIF